MEIMIGSARIDENGKIKGGIAGDQKQKSAPDRYGEVSEQKFYVHNKGWTVIRLRDSANALELAESMRIACANPNIGYDQTGRYGIVKYGTASKVPTECDCSSLVRMCFKEATGVDPGDFNTATEAATLKRTGLVDVFPYMQDMVLCVGDILVTKTKGHTVVVTKGVVRA